MFSELSILINSSAWTRRYVCDTAHKYTSTMRREKCAKTSTGKADKNAMCHADPKFRWRLYGARNRHWKSSSRQRHRTVQATSQTERPQSQAAFGYIRNANSPMCRYTLDDAQLFQNYLPGYQLLVLSTVYMYSVVNAGLYATKHICLLNHGGHFDFLNKVHAWFRSAYYGFKCLRSYDHHKKHRCDLECKLYLRANCENLREFPVYCNDCGREFFGQNFYETHEVQSTAGRSLCQQFYVC